MIENLDGEIWKTIPTYEGLYEVSNLGRIKSLKRDWYNPGKKCWGVKKERILKQRLNTGYMRCPLQKNTKDKNAKAVHRLVMWAFVGYSPLTVDHIDGDKTNNKLENLRYLSHRENVSSAALKKSKSGCVGVAWCKRRNKWRARVRHNMVEYSLGEHINVEDAILAVKNKHKELDIANAPIKPHPHKHEMSLKYLSQNASTPNQF